MKAVSAGIKSNNIPTYPAGKPERCPLFFDKRVYQGSSGKVYPLPFIDRIHDDPEDREYQVAVLENEYVYLEMLPEIGGRVFKGQDKTNGNYDFLYRQDVIKPALVGLAGPWISGGIEFNWPQHHRPGTFLPADFFIEEEKDGSTTVWMSELDPLSRMKGMHGVRLRPGSSVIEIRVRLFNATPFRQSFLWWANVAARVHDDYQSFFPPDVTYVADHAVRAISSFPNAENLYYGVDYHDRTGANDLRYYRNIPVPTSYMVCETAGNYLGGYDYREEGGFVHVANRHISPGKKQWTWGNHEFGWAWDRELTDEGGPYIELMAGVYTDNQPDFSYLMPYETKSFSQYFWPIQKTGPVQQANQDIAIRLEIGDDRCIDAAVLASSRRNGLHIVLMEGDRVLFEERTDIVPGEPWRRSDLLHRSENSSALCLKVLGEKGELLASYRPQEIQSHKTREVASEPPAPGKVDSPDELFRIGEHLELYRHPTRNPEAYWREALQRDPQDSRCHLALGKSALGRGEFDIALGHLHSAISPLTSYHPNPSTGEAHYHAGLCQKLLGNDSEAYDLIYKSTWNYEYRACGFYELACLDCRRGDWVTALDHLTRCLVTNTENNKAAVLQAIVLQKLGRGAEAEAVLSRLVIRDPLDPWALWEMGNLREDNFTSFSARIRNDAQTFLDIAFHFASAGFFKEAITALQWHQSNPVPTGPTPNPLSRSVSTRFSMAWMQAASGNLDAARQTLEEASTESADYFFPSRLDEMVILEWARSEHSSWLPCYGLGNLYYSKGRREEAIDAWNGAVARNANSAPVHRNLGIAHWNCHRDGETAVKAYRTALELDPDDPRLIFEYDQLLKKTGYSVSKRLADLENKRRVIEQRDDACVELADLYNQSDRHAEALQLLDSRSFHPWEGGEGKALQQYRIACLGIGKTLLEKDQPEEALNSFDKAGKSPANLGEAYHLHQSMADVNYWRGQALQALGRSEEARAALKRSAVGGSDFEDSSVVEYSESSYYVGLALLELGRADEAVRLFRDMLDYASRSVPDDLDFPYFATSLPNLLVFEENYTDEIKRRKDRLHKLAQSGLDLCSH